MPSKTPNKIASKVLKKATEEVVEDTQNAGVAEAPVAETTQELKSNQGLTFRGAKIVGELEQILHNGHPFTTFITEAGESYMLSQAEYEAGLK